MEVAVMGMVVEETVTVRLWETHGYEGFPVRLLPCDGLFFMLGRVRLRFRHRLRLRLRHRLRLRLRHQLRL